MTPEEIDRILTPDKEPTEILSLQSRFTLCIKSSGEVSLTIRTEEETELERLLTTWVPQIVYVPEEINQHENQNGKTRYYPGDSCPRCSNKLVSKQGRQGRFLGCSNYPDCRYASAL